jgi:hypothetical protein
MPFIPPLAARFDFGINWVSRYRYLLLVLFLLLYVLAFSLQGIWVEDFWEHSAAVSEFMRDPLSPSHPQLNLAAPHTFLNPYTFFVALTALALGLNSITALSIFGVLNFCLFCWGLKVFISSLCADKADVQKVSFYALLFILFLWGGQPWPYSGFFNFQIFLFNLPYPSTFIGALSLLTLGLIGRIQTKLGLAHWLVLVLVTSLSLLTHPLTAQFLVIGLVAQALVSRQNIFIPLLQIASLCVASVALASVWPFYPFLALLRGAGTVYDISNLTMYFHFIERIWPFIVLSPLIAWVLLQRSYRVLLFIFCATAIIYIFGFYSHKYSYGRIVSYTIMIAQLCCAIVAVRLEAWLNNNQPRVWSIYQTLLLSLLIFLSAGWLYASTTRLLTAANSIWLGRPVFNQISYKDYQSLSTHVPVGSLVFANLNASWILPSYGAKVVAALHPLAFIQDAEQRVQDTTIFFARDTPSSVRLSLLKKYNADYLLIDKTVDLDWNKRMFQSSELTHNATLFEDERFVLFKLKDSR